MRIFYIDEYGDGGMSPESVRAQPWSVLCALSLPETKRISLAGHLMNLKDRFFPGWRTHDWHDSEIKGRYLRAVHRAISRGRLCHVPPGYTGLTAPALDDLLKAIGLTYHKFAPTIYAVAVNKAESQRRHGSTAFHPIAISYVFLQQRASLLIEDVYGSDEGALFVADEQGGHERLFVDGIVHRVRQSVSGNLDRQPNFEVIFDKPLWANKEELPADREIVQLADIACYLLGTAARTNTWEDLWLKSWILPRIARHWATGQIWDAGMTIIPRPMFLPTLSP